MAPGSVHGMDTRSAATLIMIGGASSLLAASVDGERAKEVCNVSPPNHLRDRALAVGVLVC